jgi:acetyl esterase
MLGWRVSVAERAGRVGRAALRAALRAPTPLLVALSGGLVRRDGRTLDPQLAAAITTAHRLGIRSIEGMTAPAARAHVARSLGAFDAAPRPMDSVLDTSAPAPHGPVPIRLYRPRRSEGGLIVYFHGGGGVLGSIEAADPLARLIADETRCQLASVEYRLAPEFRHPAGIDDAEAAWRHLAAIAPELGIDRSRLVLLGDSMGGFLCSHVERRTRTGPRPALVALLYPLADLTFSHPSFQTLGDGFVLTAPVIRWFADHYLPDRSARRAASPVFFDDLAGAPPTLIVTAGFDPLRDEGEHLAERLRQAGARVTYRCHDDLIHGFAGMTGAIDSARAATLRLTADIRAALRPHALG